MGTCEICGTRKDRLFKTKIEGIDMFTCESCSSYGRVLTEVKPKPKKEIKAEPAEIEEAVVKNYGQLLKNAREKSGLSQEDFAKKINIRLSMLRSFENNKLVPRLELAKRMEKQLSITLIEEIKPETKIVSEKTTTPTLGDMIVYKKKK